MSSTVVQKSNVIDPASRLMALTDRLERKYINFYRTMIKTLRDRLPVDQLETLINNGRQAEAIEVIRQHFNNFADQVNQGFVEVGIDTANVLNSASIAVAFDVTNSRAILAMQRNKLELVRQMMDDQLDAIRSALVEGISQGINPRAQARLFRDAIGLTSNQEAAVRNYEQLLRMGSRESLNRALRDRRFDSTVRNSINNGQSLTDPQIERMVARYRERYVIYRSETIARTEALSAVHEGNEEMYQQAFDSGNLNPADVESTWHTRIDGRERDSHADMNGQTQPYGQPFISGNGYYLKYPGDRDAPASERVSCRCAVSRNIPQGQE